MGVYADRVVAGTQASYHSLVYRSVVCWVCHVDLGEMSLVAMVPAVSLLGWRSAFPLVSMVGDKAVGGDDDDDGGGDDVVVVVVAMSALIDDRP
jgi:hypothetical protein